MELTPIEQCQLDEIKMSGLEIPARPQILFEVQRMLQEPGVDNRALAALIGRDLKLTLSLFKIVNSAAYRLDRKVDSLEQALTIVGRRQMATVVASAALRQQLGSDATGMERFWSRSTDLATLCSIITEKTSNEYTLSREQAYIVGLFHDCGVPILMQHLPSYCSSLGRHRGPLPDILDEDDRFNTSHCLVGYMVAQHWNLPDYMYEAIRCHHYALAPESHAQERRVIAILQTALHIYNMKTGQPVYEWAYHGARALAELGIVEAEFGSFEGAAWESFEMLH